jgi:hypothetical protein
MRRITGIGSALTLCALCALALAADRTGGITPSPSTSSQSVHLTAAGGSPIDWP